MHDQWIVDVLEPYMDGSQAEEEERAQAAADEARKQYRAGRVRKLTNADLFGEQGLFRKLPRQQQSKLLETVLTALEQDTAQRIEEREQEKDRMRELRLRPQPDGIDWSEANVENRLQHLRDAARNGVYVADWRERIKQIERATYAYQSSFNQRRVNEKRQLIQQTASEIEELIGETPAELNGVGVELLPIETGSGCRLYSNGRLVTTITEGRFSEHPTNDVVVAWLAVGRIDTCPVKGSQISWRVDAWREGLEEPTCIFEDHAYEAERRLYVAPPTVREDGTVEIPVTVNGHTEIKEKSV